MNPLLVLRVGYMERYDGAGTRLVELCPSARRLMPGPWQGKRPPS